MELYISGIYEINYSLLYLFLIELRKSFASHGRSPEFLALSPWKLRFVSWIYGRRGTRQEDDLGVFATRLAVNLNYRNGDACFHVEDLYRLDKESSIFLSVTRVTRKYARVQMNIYKNIIWERETDNCRFTAEWSYRAAASFISWRSVSRIYGCLSKKSPTIDTRSQRLIRDSDTSINSELLRETRGWRAAIVSDRDVTQSSRTSSPSRR